MEYEAMSFVNGLLEDMHPDLRVDVHTHVRNVDLLHDDRTVVIDMSDGTTIRIDVQRYPTQ